MLLQQTNNNIQHKSYVFMAMVRFEQQGNCSSSQQQSIHVFINHYNQQQTNSIQA
jgi:hypothetical protein